MKTFLAAVKQYFGMKPEYKGQIGIKGFAAEIKALTDKDREELKVMLAEELKEEIAT